MWGTEKAKTGLRTEMSQHVRREERGLPFNEVRTPRRGWMQQLKDRRRRRNSKGGRCISPICHRDGEREGNGYRRCFFFFFELGWCYLECRWKLNTMARESLEHDGMERENILFCAALQQCCVCVLYMYRECVLRLISERWEACLLCHGAIL